MDITTGIKIDRCPKISKQEMEEGNRRILDSIKDIESVSRKETKEYRANHPSKLRRFINGVRIKQNYRKAEKLEAKEIKQFSKDLKKSNKKVDAMLEVWDRDVDETLDLKAIETMDALYGGGAKSLNPKPELSWEEARKKIAKENLKPVDVGLDISEIFAMGERLNEKKTAFEKALHEAGFEQNSGKAIFENT